MAEGNPTTRMMQKSRTQQTGNISADRGTDEKQIERNVDLLKQI